MKHIFLITTLILLSWNILVIAAKKKSSTSSSSSNTEVLNNVFRLQSSLKYGALIPLSDRNYSRYINESPREYSSLIMFTATDPKYGCSACHRAKGTMEEVAKLYNTQYNLTNAVQSQRLVFFTLEVDDARNLFAEYQLDTVPRVYLLPPAPAKSTKPNLSKFEIDSRPLHEGLSATLEMLKEIANIDVRIPSLVY